MKNERIRLPAPAKLNLTLRIVGRRSDGYHLLQTVFQFIDECDWITFTLRGDGQIVLVNPLPGVPAEGDLTVRAARALQQATGTASGVTIEVEKRLPMGGGLGGGSSDAATTLLGLNYLWGTGLSVEELKPMGLALGADVPIFVEGRASWAEGVGEHLTYLDLPEPWYVVVVPPCHVPTAQIFTAEDLTRNNSNITIRDFLAGQRENHCLPVVQRLYPEVKSAMDELSQYARPYLTGTGACVFAEFDNENDARLVNETLAARWKCFTTRGLNVSPVHHMIDLAS